MDAARAKVPSGLWLTLSTREQGFVARRLMCPDETLTDSAIAAGYSKKTARVIASELSRKPHIKAALACALAERIERTQIQTDDVLRRVWGIATADPNALVSHRRVPCRFCHGKDHEYQRTPAEMRRDRAKWEAAQTKKSLEAFDEMGGSGYDRRKDPHPDCPECFGDGEGLVFLADTRRLTGDAALLYAGTKETDKGVEVKLLDQGAALRDVMRHLGMFAEKQEAPEDADARAARIRAQLDAMDATVPRAA